MQHLQRTGAGAGAAVQATSGSGRKWLKAGIYALVALAIVGYIADEFDTGSSGPPASGPLVTPAPSPLVTAAPAPAAPARASDIPNLAGLWRTLDGETYQITQNGTQLSLTAHAAGQNVGSGQGQLDGNLLRLSMSMVINGVPLAAANCNLQATPDFSRFAGICSGPGGQFTAQMFR